MGTDKLESPRKISTETPASSFIVIDNSPQKNVEISKLIEASQRQVQKILSEALQFEEAGIKAEFGDKVTFKTIQQYTSYLLENNFIRKSDTVNPRLIPSLTIYLVRHWELAKNQVNNQLNDVKNWQDYFSKDKFHNSPSRCISFATETRMYPWELSDAITIDDINNDSEYGRTRYATHTSSVSGIDKDKIIYSANGANFACSTVVSGRSDGQTYVFKTSDLIKAVPFVFDGTSTTGGENEITTWFPIPRDLARAVLPTKIILNNDGVNAILRSGYTQAQLSPEMFLEKVG